MQKLCLGCMNPAASTEVCPHCGYVEGTPAKEPYHIPPGTMLRHYLIGRVLGYGGFGVTYIGYDTKLNIKVAIKEYLPGELATRMPGDTQVTVYSGEKTQMFETGREKFLDEARRLAKFTGEPGIVSIQDEFDENGTCYIVMEFLEGETLKQKLEREGKLPVEQAVEIITPILDALTAVHEKSIIHRDISPDNIFLTTDGRIKLLDFGAARYASSNQSKSLSVILKPGYAPEEQYRSRGDQGPWSDVYACAATIYKMITGQTPEDAMERTLKDELKPPSKLGVKINKNCETAIMNALNIYKDNRTQSTQEFKEQLSGAVNVTRLRNTHKLVDIGSWKTWHKVALASILTVLALIVVASAVLLPKGTGLIDVIINRDTTQVPDVVRMTEDEATDAANNADLTPMIVNGDYSDSIAFGTIVNQNIPSGRAVKRRSYLEMVMSLGKKQIELPNVSGWEQEKALKELSETGFVVTIVEEYSNFTPGTIIRQEPEPGLYDNGTEILIAVSLGLEGLDTSKTVKLEKYVGRSFDEVQKELEAAGIYIRKETAYSSEAEGIILEQGTPEGEEVKQGFELKLVVSLGEQTVRLGNYYAWNLQDAIKELKSLGIEASWEYVDNDLYAKDLIIAQSPDAGTSVLPKTAKVKLTVSKGRNQVEVPGVVQMSRADAIRTLENAGFIVDEYEAFSDTVAAGYVMEQDPDGGYAYEGQTIAIYTSKGKSAKNPTGLSLTPSSLTLYYPSSNGGQTLVAAITPADADDQRIIWSSSNPNVASVSANGVVTPTGVGNATITAKTNTGGITANCAVTVEPRKAVRISVSTPATKLEYYPNEFLSTAGLALLVEYNSGETEVVRSGFSATPSKLDKIEPTAVTVYYGDLTTTYNVTVVKPIIDHISVENMPNKTKYTVNDPLSTTGMTVRVHYTNGTSEVVDTGFTCTPTMLVTEGKQIVTAVYSGFSTSFTVEVVVPPVETIKIDQLPYVLDYNVGDSLNTNGLTLLVTYTNGMTKKVSTDINCSPTLLTTSGNQTVTVTYGGQKTTYTVNVKKIVLESIEIRTAAQKTEYAAGEALDVSGLTLTGNYSDGHKETITNGFTCTPNILKEDTKQITVTYEGYQTTYAVKVTKQRTLSSIDIVTNPTRMTYLVGESFDDSGMVLKADYSDGTTEEVRSGWDTDWDFSSAGRKQVTISYTAESIKKVVLLMVDVFEAETKPENVYDDLATVVASSATGRAGQEVTVSLYLFNNPGYAGAGVQLYVDSALTVVLADEDETMPLIDEGDALAGLTPICAYNEDTEVIAFATMGMNNNTQDGRWVTFHFIIPPNAASGTVYEIRLTTDKFMNISREELSLDCVNGTITVL